ncbi:hypothetical protein ACFCV3_41995 [Kribbella sp. NPDC056345]|uniref:hypothetical protein n=1 Tax=Kribbella sp. NPDC056345 TaxID=3345789 RepID=UPI0035D8F020
MHDRTTPPDDDDDPALAAAGRELADELKRQARMELPMLRAAWRTSSIPADELTGLAS